MGLAGESGSGKSTLGYAITRLLKPPAEISGGEVLYYPSDASQQMEGIFGHFGLAGSRLMC